MNLIFTKGEDDTTKLEINLENSRIPFTYIALIEKLLVQNDILAETEFNGEFEQEEIDSFNLMVSKINEVIKPSED